MLKHDKAIWSRMGWVIAASLVAVSGATAQTGAPQRDLVLEGATLIDGTGRAPVPDAVVVVEGNRIKAAGKRGQVQIPANANIVQVSGRTILPGLIDSHTHTQDWQMPMFLHYGVTTIADLNNDGPWILAQREGLKNGKIKGPRMLVSGTFIWGPLQPRDNGTFNTPATATVEQARAVVRGLVKDGVDIIKVDNGLTDDQLRAIVEEANKAGLPSLGHTQNIVAAANVGFKVMEHMDTMARGIMDPDEKTPIRLYPGQGGFIAPPQVTSEAVVDPKKFPAEIALLVKDGVFVNPTMQAVSWMDATPRGKEFEADGAKIAKDPALTFVPDEAKKSWSTPRKPRGGYDHVALFLREYVAAGGRVIVGTDTGGAPIVPGLAEQQEMQMLTDAGLTPMQAIQGATLWNAQLLKKDKDLGSVEPGKLADILVVEGDPLKDIAAVKNVRMVIKDGAVVDTAYDPKWVNPLPMPYSSFFRSPPQITGLSPRVARQGGAPVTLTVQGSKFTPNAVVRFDNSDLPTHFVSPTELTATLGANMLQKNPGSYPLYVVNPGVHGYVSTAAYFLVNFKQ